jgi:hypothetical protein
MMIINLEGTSQPGIKGVSQTIPHEIESQNNQHDGKTGRE